ncbi:HTH domain-containing protein [Nesterenkonia sp. E16_7]|uniref:HTH domain-containing protein n=1 Tax=Nesterenkonia sp. E16_10 TaxID=2789296 RepID=UPI001A937DD9|nr:HTH domain-containing protein [Nesterenkonia sp. E16_10]MBO0598226.1 HTH domain-containing protein [Nesterenkonia sp. E16_7]
METHPARSDCHQTQDRPESPRIPGRFKELKPSPSKPKHLLATHKAGTHTQTELAELSDVSRATVYREIQRAQPEG